jgi:hypothetical protein
MPNRSELTQLDFRVDEQQDHFVITIMYKGRDFAYRSQSASSPQYVATRFRVKFTFTKGFKVKGFPPSATLEAMTLPVPGHWTVVDELTLSEMKTDRSAIACISIAALKEKAYGIAIGRIPQISIDEVDNALSSPYAPAGVTKEQMMRNIAEPYVNEILQELVKSEFHRYLEHDMDEMERRACSLYFS